MKKCVFEIPCCRAYAIDSGGLHLVTDADKKEREQKTNSKNKQL